MVDLCDNARQAHNLGTILIHPNREKDHKGLRPGTTLTAMIVLRSPEEAG